MTREYRITDKKRGIVQITTDDERWYMRLAHATKTEKEHLVYLPSSSWIASYYPKGIGYMKWLADKGWNEAEAIKEDRGKHGTKVHKAVELLLAGEEIRLDMEVPNPKTGGMEALSVEEYGAVISFVDWWKTLEKPEVIESEHTIWNEQDGYAGMLDFVLKIDGMYWLIDLKTSQSIWPSHEIQLASYKHAYALESPAIGNSCRLAIFQAGYRKNKNRYKFTEIDDKYELFISTRKIWQNECVGDTPFQRDYPLAVSLGVKANMSKGVRPKKVIKKTNEK